MKRFLLIFFLCATSVFGQVVYDSFTDATSTPLTSHTTDTGQTWSLQVDPVFTIQNASTFPTATGTVANLGNGSTQSGEFAYVESGIADVDIECYVRTGNSPSNKFPGIVFRHSTGENALIAAIGTDDVLYLQKMETGVITDENTVNVGFDVGFLEEYKLRVVAIGSAITVTLTCLSGSAGGCVTVNLSDVITFNQTETKHGIYGRDLTDQYDDFTVNQVGSWPVRRRGLRR